MPVAEDGKAAQEAQLTQFEPDTVTIDTATPNGVTAAKFKPGIKFKLASWAVYVVWAKDSIFRNEPFEDYLQHSLPRLMIFVSSCNESLVIDL